MTNNKQSYEKGQVYKIKISELKPDPDQPRKYIDETALNELEKSIKQHGILQPILFRIDESGQKIIVAGERRFQASKNIGNDEISALFIDGKHAEIALVENLLRQNLTPMEEAEALQKMKDEFSYTETVLAKVLCKGKSTISEILSLNKLPAEIREECRVSSQIPRDKLVEIAKLEKPEDMIKLYEQIKKDNLSRKEIRKIKEELRDDKVEKPQGKSEDEKDELLSIEKHAEKLLELVKKMKVKINKELKEKIEDTIKEIQMLLE